MPNGHAATKDEMTANTNHGSVATDKDGGAKWWRGKQQMRQTNKKMWYGNQDQIIKWARLMKML
jgi:hypothetical protein